MRSSRPAPVPFQTAARTLLRDTVMAAVDDLVRTRGWSATTMADVARASGVSRQTLYNEFGTRPSLVEAYVTREIETLVGEVTDVVQANADNAHVALRGAFEMFLKLASDEPLIQIIVSDTGDGELMRMLTTLGQALAADRVAHLIPQLWPQVSDADAQLLAGTLVRLAISHSMVPVEDPGVVAAGISRMLAPFVDRILGVD